MQVVVRDLDNGYVVSVMGQPDRVCFTLDAVMTILSSTLQPMNSAVLTSIATAATAAAKTAPPPPPPPPPTPGATS